MQVVINCGSPRDLKDLFRFELDFLDFYVTSESVYIIANRPDAYVHHEFKVVSRYNFHESQSMRIEKKDFLALAIEGSLTIAFRPGGMVELTFGDDETTFSLIRKHQKSDITSILSKMDVVSKKASFTKIELGSVSRFISLFTGFTQIVSVIDNMVVADDGNVQLYCKVDVPNLSVSTSGLNYLIKQAETVYMFQNYLIGFNESTVILIKQTVTPIASNFEYIEKMGSSHLLNVDVSSVCALSKRISGHSLITMNFNKESAQIDGDRLVLKTGFKVNNIVNAKSTKVTDEQDILANFSMDSVGSINLDSIGKAPSLKIPSKLFSTYLTYLDKTKIRIFIKKSFVVMKAGKYVSFVIGRVITDD